MKRERWAVLGLMVCVPLALALAGCVKEYSVAVVNERSVPVTVQIKQYHSEGFNGVPPRTYSDELLVEEKTVQLAVAQRRTLEFNSSSGGFWLRWQTLDIAATSGSWSVLDLERDELVIHVR
jgi:hypothetical protein